MRDTPRRLVRGSEPRPPDAALQVSQREQPTGLRRLLQGRRRRLCGDLAKTEVLRRPGLCLPVLAETCWGLDHRVLTRPTESLPGLPQPEPRLLFLGLQCPSRRGKCSVGRRPQCSSRRSKVCKKSKEWDSVLSHIKWGYYLLIGKHGLHDM